jgi:hypothetical protein
MFVKNKFCLAYEVIYGMHPRSPWGFQDFLDFDVRSIQSWGSEK